MAALSHILVNASTLPHFSQNNGKNLTRDDFITTTTQNFVSRDAQLENASQIEMKGRSVVEQKTLLQGPIRIGRYCHIQECTKITPSTLLEDESKEVLVTIGSHTSIGRNCDIKAAAIGSYCWIGDDTIIGERVIIKDGCVISSGVTIADDTVVPPFTFVSAGKCVGSINAVMLPPSTAAVLQERSSQMYREFSSLIIGTDSSR